MKFLTSQEATVIDQVLMNSEIHGFSTDQLMELAGLSVSHVCYHLHHKSINSENNKCLIIAGPGNNGGDALVAARHLKHFGFEPIIIYPRKEMKDLYKRLLLQCKNIDISIYYDWNEFLDKFQLKDFNFILDGIFGYSFSGNQGIREPYKTIIDDLKKEKNGMPDVIAIDIPSGWDVDSVDLEKNLQIGLHADVLISLTAPKICAKCFKGKHFLGGRFVPKAMELEYDMQLPKYPGTEIFIDITEEQ
ncbi:hypothetical protein ABK040_010693 [Willaertia magna]